MCVRESGVLGQEKPFQASWGGGLAAGIIGLLTVGGIEGTMKLRISRKPTQTPQPEAAEQVTLQRKNF